MKTESAMQDMVLNNTGLAHKVAAQFLGCGIDWDELNSIALLGLVKAAGTFDESKGNSFSTYAYAVMKNEIRLEMRKQKKYFGCVSLDAETPFPVGDGSYCTLADTIPCDETGFERIENSDLLGFMMRLPELKERERQVLLLIICDEVNQQEAGKRIGITQSMVSRYFKSGIWKMRNAYYRQERRTA